MEPRETFILSDEASAENRSRPPAGRLASLFSDHQLREDLKILAPAIGILFAVLIILRTAASGWVFWPAAVVGGCGVYAFLCRSGHRRQVTVARPGRPSPAAMVNERFVARSVGSQSPRLRRRSVLP